MGESFFSWCQEIIFRFDNLYEKRISAKANYFKRRILLQFPCTCVVVPDADFPNFSQVVVCLQVELVQASTLKSSVPLQVARATLVHTVQTDANMCCGA